MLPQPLHRSEAFAEDLPGFDAAPQPRGEVPRYAPPSSRAAARQLLWPLALALTAASVLAAFAPPA